MGVRGPVGQQRLRTVRRVDQPPFRHFFNAGPEGALIRARPLVTVVMPVYNCEAYVGDAVRSALAQEYPHVEVLVIDDGSRDGTVDVLRGFGDAIRIIQVPNGGPARARNLGMDQAQGEFIAFLDADDIWHPDKLRVQVEHLCANPAVGGCYTRWHVWAPEPGRGFVVPPAFADGLGSARRDEARSGWIYGRLLLDCELLTTTVMLRRSVADRVGRFVDDLPLGEDYDYWLRLSQAAEISCLDQVGALYRVLPGSASRGARVRNFEHEVVRGAVDRFGLVSPGGPAISARVLQGRLDRLAYQHAYQHLTAGDPRLALRGFGRLLRRQPLRAGLWLKLLSAARRALRPGAAGAVR